MVKQSMYLKNQIHTQTKETNLILHLSDLTHSFSFIGNSDQREHMCRSPNYCTKRILQNTVVSKENNKSSVPISKKVRITTVSQFSAKILYFLFLPYPVIGHSPCGAQYLVWCQADCLCVTQLCPSCRKM
jgi:hypothetical protein